jgi:hypothetical protein
LINARNNKAAATIGRRTDSDQAHSAPFDGSRLKHRFKAMFPDVPLDFERNRFTRCDATSCLDR